MAKNIVLTWDAEPNSNYYTISLNGTVLRDNIEDTQVIVSLDELVSGQPNELSIIGVNQFGESKVATTLTVNFTLPGQVQNFHYTIES